MDKIRDFPDGSRTAVILALFPLAWKPDARHRSLTGTPKSSGYFSVKDTAPSLHGFPPERSFTKDRRVIDMRIDSLLMVLRHARPVLPADRGFHRVYRRARQPVGHGASRVLSDIDTVGGSATSTQPAAQRHRHSRRPHPDGEAAQNAAA
jgi:hypothetical protein